MTTSAPAVRITSLPAYLLKFPPDSDPATLPVPAGNPTFAHPFTIPPEIFNGLLSANVPITAALIYASVVTYLNTVNARRKYKPWAFSKTRRFRGLVIAHNIFLALYSAWTCAGMINALRLSLPEWKEYGLAGTVDSLCKINGPRGLGDAVRYNATSNVWSFTNQFLRLGADGLTPDTTDVGRIWNEGLAFYGWLFYISKFYEVIDSFIILAKGKKSSVLQTYHHAGAMMCMWAGIRYMAQPIWMFVLVNSGLHAIMYTYYTLTSFSVKVPRWFKKTLTTLQITQFIIGASYAFLHLFIAYQIPVSVPYLYHLGDVVASATQDLSSAASVATATASAGAGAWLKKAAFRAAGHEGLAENVVNEQGQTFGVDALHAMQDYQTRTETRYSDDLHWVHCLDTSGQVFAILLNCLYLAPLTWLFLRFFARAYAKRLERRRSSTASEKANVAAWASKDAAKGVARQLKEVATEGAFEEEDFAKSETRVTHDESVKSETRTTHEESVNGSPQGKREVGDEPAPEDRTPELKQDDSFVKVEAEPESPTEVKSINDEEEPTDEQAGQDENSGEESAGESERKSPERRHGKKLGDKQTGEAKKESGSISESSKYVDEAGDAQIKSESEKKSDQAPQAQSPSKSGGDVETKEKPDSDSGPEAPSEATEASTKQPSDKTRVDSPSDSETKAVEGTPSEAPVAPTDTEGETKTTPQTEQNPQADHTPEIPGAFDANSEPESDVDRMLPKVPDSGPDAKDALAPVDALGPEGESKSEDDSTSHAEKKDQEHSGDDDDAKRLKTSTSAEKEQQDEVLEKAEIEPLVDQSGSTAAKPKKTSNQTVGAAGHHQEKSQSQDREVGKGSRKEQDTIIEKSQIEPLASSLTSSATNPEGEQGDRLVSSEDLKELGLI